MQRVTHATLLHCEPCYASTGQGGPEDLWRDFAGNRERYAASSRYLFPPPSAPPLVSLRRRRSSSCQSNWLRRATKILRCSSPLRGHLRAGDINQCRVFRVPLLPPPLSLSHQHPFFSVSRFKVISTDADRIAPFPSRGTERNRLNLCANSLSFYLLLRKVKIVQTFSTVEILHSFLIKRIT